MHRDLNYLTTTINAELNKLSVLLQTIIVSQCKKVKLSPGKRYHYLHDVRLIINDCKIYQVEGVVFLGVIATQPTCT